MTKKKKVYSLLLKILKLYMLLVQKSIFIMVSFCNLESKIYQMY